MIRVSNDAPRDPAFLLKWCQDAQNTLRLVSLGRSTGTERAKEGEEGEEEQTQVKEGQKGQEKEGQKG